MVSKYLIIATTAAMLVLASRLLADDLLISKECQENNETLHVSCNVRFIKALQIESVGVKFFVGDTELEYTQQQERFEQEELDQEQPEQEVINQSDIEQEESQQTNTEQIIINYTSYSQISERKTLIYILIDTSDPRRQAIVEKKVSAVKKILESANNNTYIGIATFYDGLHEILETTNNTITFEQVLDDVQAVGQITEFYRSLLEALEKVKTISADRRFVMILSDGNAEDTAYSQEDILNAKNSVGIISLGYPNSQTDRIHLQNLRQLSEETYGIYLEASVEENVIPDQSLMDIVPTLESGGIIDIDLSKNYTAGNVLTIGIKTNQDEEIEFQLTPDFDILAYWKFRILSQKQLFGGLIAIILLVFLLWILYRIKSKPKQLSGKVLAKIELMDSNENWFEIKSEKISIGRKRDNDLVIENKTVSSRHAILQLSREGKWVVIDTNSTNGVIVNRKLIKQAMLNDGTIIELGDVRLRLHYGK